MLSDMIWDDTRYWRYNTKTVVLENYYWEPEQDAFFEPTRYLTIPDKTLLHPTNVFYHCWHSYEYIGSCKMFYSTRRWSNLSEPIKSFKRFLLSVQQSIKLLNFLILSWNSRLLFSNVSPSVDFQTQIWKDWWNNIFEEVLNVCRIAI
jgi:hypothetical protein